MSAVLVQVRNWLVDAAVEPDDPGVRQALDHLGVVAEPAQLDALVRRLCAQLTGAGLLQPLLTTPGVTDVLVNGPDRVFVDRGGGLQPAGVRFEAESEVRALAQRLAAQAGRRLDDAAPFVDARLPDGVRLHAALPPVASPGTLISLRVPARTRFDLSTLVQTHAISRAGAAWLQALVAARCAFLVTGATGSGKTTVLRALLQEVPAQSRIVAVEESAELEVPHPHFVRLEARPPNAEGQGAMTLPELIRQAMRMRPDRIVVGEVRGIEVTALLMAMNTGHEGSCGTIHANSPQTLPARIEALALPAGLDRAGVHSQLAAGLDAVLHVERTVAGQRRISSLGVVRRGSAGQVEVTPAVSFAHQRPRVLLPGHPTVQRLLASQRTPA